LSTNFVGFELALRCKDVKQDIENAEKKMDRFLGITSVIYVIIL